MNEIGFDIYRIINEAMEKKDRYVTIYCSETGTSISIYPLTEDDVDWPSVETALL